jgi:hypothetical protein
LLLPAHCSSRADIRRTADAAACQVSVGWSEGSAFSKWSEDTSPKKLANVNARYGNTDSWLDVTLILQAAVPENRLCLTPSFG